MSMIGNFRMASDEEIQMLMDDPDSITRLLYPDSTAPDGGVAEMTVDKAWHGIHFLLCGQTWEGDPPLNFIVSGGTPIGDVDVGYGPARALNANETATLAEALTPITAHALRQQFNAKTFFDHDIYPEIWNEPVEECIDGYVLTFFDELKRFVLKTRDAKKGLIVYIN